MLEALDDHMGDVWEEAFRGHLRELAVDDDLPASDPVVEVGAWWGTDGKNQIDALVLAGRSGVPAIAGEAKWKRSVDGSRLVHNLRQKVDRGLGVDPDRLVYALCARSEIRSAAEGTLPYTARDLFPDPVEA